MSCKQNISHVNHPITTALYTFTDRRKQSDHPYGNASVNIGVAGNFSGGALFFHQNVDAPTVQISPISSKKWTLALPGVHLNFPPVNLAQNFFSALGGGAHVDPVHPLATPMSVNETKWHSLYEN